MKKIDINLPLAVTRVLTPKVQELAAGMDTVVRRIQQEEDAPLPLEEKDIPHLTITHQLSIMKNRDQMVSSGHYEALKGPLPEMRSDLKAIGFDEPTGYFKTICLVPIALIYNRSIDNPPTAWADLVDERWKGKIGAPSLDILRKLLQFYVRGLLGNDAGRLISNVVFDGMPIDINLKIDDGSLDIGIIPLPFARASRNKNVVMRWPIEGAVCLPQVLIHKKGSFEDTIKISEYLLSDDVQRYISDAGGIIPVSPNVPLPHEVGENHLNLFWKGWDWFIAGINEV